MTDAVIEIEDVRKRFKDTLVLKVMPTGLSAHRLGFQSPMKYGTNVTGR